VPDAGRRALVSLALLALAGAPALAACTAPGLSYHSAVTVQFTPQTAYDVALHARVRAACDHLPGVSALALDKLTAEDLVFEIGRASAREQAALYSCLTHQPGVASVSVQSSDDGE
jgi:hypothetical protein